MNEAVFDLSTTPVHLGLGAGATTLPLFTGEPSWYAEYGQAHSADGREGRLVTLHTFAQSWEGWEMHPSGHEVVICIAGRLRLLQELPAGGVAEIMLGPGEAVINDPGVWHTADVVDAPVRALFITAGMGTEGRPR